MGGSGGARVGWCAPCPKRREGCRVSVRRASMCIPVGLQGSARRGGVMMLPPHAGTELLELTLDTHKCRLHLPPLQYHCRPTTALMCLSIRTLPPPPPPPPVPASPDGAPQPAQGPRGQHVGGAGVPGPPAQLQGLQLHAARSQRRLVRAVGCRLPGCQSAQLQGSWTHTAHGDAARTQPLPRIHRSPTPHE